MSTNTIGGNIRLRGIDIEKTKTVHAAERLKRKKNCKELIERKSRRELNKKNKRRIKNIIQRHKYNRSSYKKLDG